MTFEPAPVYAIYFQIYEWKTIKISWFLTEFTHKNELAPFFWPTVCSTGTVTKNDDNWSWLIAGVKQQLLMITDDRLKSVCQNIMNTARLWIYAVSLAICKKSIVISICSG